MKKLCFAVMAMCMLLSCGGKNEKGAATEEATLSGLMKSDFVSEVDGKPTALYVLKNKNNGVNIDRSNLLHPFYMVYLSHTGTVICDHLSPKKLLDKMRYACKDKTEPDKTLCKQFNKETRDGKNMRHYSDLLQSAIESIITVKEESDIESLFSVGETSALTYNIKGLDDFELICFLVIK